MACSATPARRRKDIGRRFNLTVPAVIISLGHTDVHGVQDPARMGAGEGDTRKPQGDGALRVPRSIGGGRREEAVGDGGGRHHPRAYQAGGRGQRAHGAGHILLASRLGTGKDQMPCMRKEAQDRVQPRHRRRRRDTHGIQLLRMRIRRQISVHDAFEVRGEEGATWTRSSGRVA